MKAIIIVEVELTEGSTAEDVKNSLQDLVDFSANFNSHCDECSIYVMP